jgi:hypothetical protein
VDGEENKTTCDELVNAKTLSKSMENLLLSRVWITIITPHCCCDAKDLEAMKM